MTLQSVVGLDQFLLDLDNSIHTVYSMVALVNSLSKLGQDHLRTEISNLAKISIRT